MLVQGDKVDVDQEDKADVRQILTEGMFSRVYYYYLISFCYYQIFKIFTERRSGCFPQTQGARL